jgi:hypothetical protein
MEYRHRSRLRSGCEYGCGFRLRGGFFHYDRFRLKCRCRLDYRSLLDYRCR